jgi:glyoxylase-like metal-dependent hydrolase (beta-lactamase superfamily II)
MMTRTSGLCATRLYRQICRLAHAWRQQALGLALLMLASGQAVALEVHFERVAEGVYAYVGDMGPRTLLNEGLNANLGLVVTPQGSVLIDSGATFESARKIAEAVGRVTSQPVRWVINTGGQDHRWLGNGYFKGLGAEILAHSQAQADMRNRGNEQVDILRAVLGARAAGTIPTLPTRWLSLPDERLVLGGVAFEFKHRGGAHTPGDMLVWLPDQQVMFSGDTVYVDRMLGVLAVSQTRHWLATFAEIEKVMPARIVPGHGRVTNLATAQADTRDYLLALRSHMKKAVDDNVDLSSAIRSFDARLFLRLINAAELNPGNASRTYLEIERE